MEADQGMGLVLARATELRLKISDCIEKATTNIDVTPNDDLKVEGFVNGDKTPNGSSKSEEEESSEQEEDKVDEEAERLLHIHDVLEALETQLAGLQNLRQRQQYEKQVALSEIDYSRKMLLETLKDYKGRDLDVIHEASAFVGEKVEYENDLLLPPYPSRPPQSMVFDNGYVSHLTSKPRPVQNGVIPSKPANELKNQDGSPQPRSENSRKGIGHFVVSLAKIVLPVVGLISVLSLTGLGPDIRKKNNSLKYLSLFQSSAAKEQNASFECPPGKIAVVENGETRCLVKERVEIPIASVVASRDVNYGYG